MAAVSSFVSLIGKPAGNSDPSFFPSPESFPMMGEEVHHCSTVRRSSSRAQVLASKASCWPQSSQTFAVSQSTDSSPLAPKSSAPPRSSPSCSAFGSTVLPPATPHPAPIIDHRAVRYTQPWPPQLPRELGFSRVSPITFRAFSTMSGVRLTLGQSCRGAQASRSPDTEYYMRVAIHLTNPPLRGCRLHAILQRILLTTPIVLP